MTPRNGFHFDIYGGFLQKYVEICIYHRLYEPGTVEQNLYLMLSHVLPHPLCTRGVCREDREEIG